MEGRKTINLKESTYRVLFDVRRDLEGETGEVWSINRVITAAICGKLLRAKPHPNSGCNACKNGGYLAIRLIGGMEGCSCECHVDVPDGGKRKRRK